LYNKATTPIIRLKDSFPRRHPSRRLEIDSTQLDIDLVADYSMPFTVKIWVLVDTRTGALIGWIQFAIPAKTTRARSPFIADKTDSSPGPKIDMSKKPDFCTEEGIARRHAERRGQGDGKDYLSWIFVPDFSSKGLRFMIYSAKLGRVVHIFSLLELFVFIFAESHESFVEIKENFPLDRHRTLRIAGQQQPALRHPEVDGVPMVMTTDLFIKEMIAPGVFQYLAWSTKYQDELRNPRPVVKLQIEQIFHEGKEAEIPATFTIMTKEKLPKDMVENLRFVRGTTRPGAMLEYSAQQIDRVAEFMRPRLADYALNKLSHECDKALGFGPGLSSLRVARYLIATNRWPVDLKKLIDPFRPLPLLAAA
jgi:hypothetical protein